MKAIVTICSQSKNKDPRPMPARERYISSRIQAVEKISKELSVPFFILSGKFGLISADENIPNYDYSLEATGIDKLVPTMVRQINDLDLTDIEFYAENKEGWIPYVSVLKKAADTAKASLTIRPLPSS